MRLSYGTRVLRLSLSLEGLDFVQYFCMFTKNERHENYPGLLKKEPFTWSGDKEAIMLLAIQRSGLGFWKKKWVKEFNQAIRT